jgi:hypothetical protein
MFPRIRIAFGLAWMLALFISIPALAKGRFSFISITGPDLKEAVRLSDPSLTAVFFTFADFSKAKTEAPTDPGIGYEVTRYYVDGTRESAFDKLHYYPESGFVYYDGIVNGSSEYDGKWYTAKSEIKTIFEAALFNQIRLVALGSKEAAQALIPPPQPVTAVDPVQSRQPFAQTQVLLSIAVAVSVVMVLAFAFRRRRISAH